MFLGVGIGVAATQLTGFVDVKRKLAGNFLVTYPEAGNFGTAPGLALP